MGHIVVSSQLLLESKGLQSASLALGARTDDFSRRLWSQITDQESEIAQLEYKYQRDNDNIYYDKVPSANQLQLPTPVSLFKIKPFTFFDGVAPNEIDISLKKKSDTCTIQ